MATARFMETWAHSLDVHDALGVTYEPTDRIRHVAHLGVRTRNFAFGVHGLEPPAEEFRVELTAPSGDAVGVGPADAAQSVRGSAYDFCLRVTQRRHRDDLDLVADGRRRRPLARHRPGLRRSARTRAGTAVTAVRIANCSGFYGDRLSAMREMLDGGPVDVITGDYLAELTMLILGRDRMRDPSLGYARTFVRQVEDCLGDGARARRARSSATPAASTRPGWPTSCARSPTGLGLDPAIAWVDGDDLMPQAAELGWEGALTANAYLGGVRHRPGARRPAPTSSSPAGSPTPRWSSGRRSGGTAGRPRRTTSWRVRSSPATSSSAAARPPAATSPASSTCRATGGRSASRSPRSPPTAAR